LGFDPLHFIFPQKENRLAFPPGDTDTKSSSDYPTNTSKLRPPDTESNQNPRIQGTDQDDDDLARNHYERRQSDEH
jgi:hypothetical protein